MDLRQHFIQLSYVNVVKHVNMFSLSEFCLEHNLRLHPKSTTTMDNFCSKSKLKVKLTVSD